MKASNETHFALESLNSLLIGFHKCFLELLFLLLALCHFHLFLTFLPLSLESRDFPFEDFARVAEFHVQLFMGNLIQAEKQKVRKSL